MMDETTYITLEQHMEDTQRIDFLRDKVLDRLNSIDKHLVELNGSVARNTKDVAAAKIIAEALQAEYVKHCVALAVLETRNTFQQQQLMDAKADTREQLGEQSSQTRELTAKVWDMAWKLSAVVSALALLAKLANVW